ncbi:MAG TPA: hypothetical protein PLA27_11500 [Anaerolineales bacterium]|jgi:hypothetical protein|nr:hypothetical protein [Anaerolineales bacterium]
MTIFIFTDKAQKLFGEAKGNLYFDVFLVIASFGFLLYAIYIRTHDKNRSIARYIITGLLFLTFSVSWFNDENQRYRYLSNQYSELTSAYRNREYKIVEGYVEVLHKEPEGGHDTGDVIRINGVEFELSCFHNTFGYNKTIVFGGVLNEGVFATVYYYQPDGLSGRDVVIMRIDMLEKITNTASLDPLFPCADY